LIIIQVVQTIQLLWTILHEGFFFDDLLRHGSRSMCRGCDGVPFIIIILILIIIVLSHAVESILFAISVISLSHDWIIPSKAVFSFFSF
jgi:hypothetical protein